MPVMQKEYSFSPNSTASEKQVDEECDEDHHDDEEEEEEEEKKERVITFKQQLDPEMKGTGVGARKATLLNVLENSKFSTSFGIFALATDRDENKFILASSDRYSAIFSGSTYVELLGKEGRRAANNHPVACDLSSDGSQFCINEECDRLKVYSTASLNPSLSVKTHGQAACDAEHAKQSKIQPVAVLSNPHQDEVFFSCQFSPMKGRREILAVTRDLQILCFDLVKVAERDAKYEETGAPKESEKVCDLMGLVANSDIFNSRANSTSMGSVAPSASGDFIGIGGDGLFQGSGGGGGVENAFRQDRYDTEAICTFRFRVDNPVIDLKYEPLRGEFFCLGQNTVPMKLEFHDSTNGQEITSAVLPLDGLGNLYSYSSVSSDARIVNLAFDSLGSYVVVATTLPAFFIVAIEPPATKESENSSSATSAASSSSSEKNNKEKKKLDLVVYRHLEDGAFTGNRPQGSYYFYHTKLLSAGFTGCAVAGSASDATIVLSTENNILCYRITRPLTREGQLAFEEAARKQKEAEILKLKQELAQMEGQFLLETEGEEGEGGGEAKRGGTKKLSQKQRKKQQQQKQLQARIHSHTTTTESRKERIQNTLRDNSSSPLIKATTIGDVVSVSTIEIGVKAGSKFSGNASSQTSSQSVNTNLTTVNIDQKVFRMRFTTRDGGARLIASGYERIMIVDVPLKWPNRKKVYLIALLAKAPFCQHLRELLNEYWAAMCKVLSFCPY